MSALVFAIATNQKSTTVIWKIFEFGVIHICKGLSWDLLDCWLTNSSDKLHEVFIPWLDKYLHTSGSKTCINKFNINFLLKLLHVIGFTCNTPAPSWRESLEYSLKAMQVGEHVKSECIQKLTENCWKFLWYFAVMHIVEKDVVRKRIGQNKNKGSIKCWRVTEMDWNRMSWT